MRVTCRVMFYVQHLLGIGHLKRASLIARAMAAAGLDVSVALGGREVPGVDFAGCARILLPSVHAADETFETLLDEKGEPIDDEWRDNRAARLVFEFEALRPHVLMLELFPFGRRMFSFELLPLLTAARAAPTPPRIVSSVRDILVRKSDAERNRKAVAFAHTWFDRILVHGDPKLVPIEASFPEMAEIADKLAYTGYVVETDELTAPAPESPIGEGEVIVSAGGGAVGLPLLHTALAAKRLSRLADRTWRLITGPNLSDRAFAEVAWLPPPGVIVERWRADLPALFRTCAVSISQAGYNTVMDLLRAHARAVLVPFAAGGETEQTLRARVLADRGLAVAVDTATLSPKILADAIDEALTLSPPCVEIDCTGAETTARLVGEMCEAGGT
jgi:predicted glycosyltransferase